MRETREQDFDNATREPSVDIPLTTKAGIVAVPGAVTLLVDLLAHGGYAPIGITGVVLACLACNSPKILETAGKNKQLLVALSTHDEWRARLDRLSDGHFTKQISKLQRERPDLFERSEQSSMVDVPMRRAQADNNEMEPLQPSTGASFFERFPQNETMYLGRVVTTGQRFDPHIDWLLGDGGVIAGQPGAGKSNLLGLMATGAARCGMAAIVIDYKREFYTLNQVVEGFCWAGHPGFAAEAGESYYALTAETAADFADIVMSWNFLAVIDVPSYAGRANELAETLTALLNALMDRAQAQKESERLPCLLFVDEAHNFWPEERKLSAFSTMKKESFDALQAAHNRIVTGGRSYGFTMIVATQRIANIAKWAIAPLQIKVIMRHRELNDLKRCKEDAGEADQRAITTLEPGQGIVIGLTDDPITVQFDRQPARHVSVTPTIKRVHAKRAEQPAPQISQALSRREQGREQLFSQAQQIYEPGVSHHDLARILDTDTGTAIELFKLLKRFSVSSVSALENAGNNLETEPETCQEAGSRIITGVFANASTPLLETKPASVENNTSAVSNDIRETIRRGRSMKPPIPHRTIANMVGFGGRKYEIYQQVCREMGLMSAAEVAER